MASDVVGADRTLVLAPASAGVMWRRRFAEWSVYSHECRVMATRKDRPLEAGVTICSYDLAAKKPLSDKLRKCEWDLVILDESHYVKSRGSARSRLVWNGIFPNAKRVWALSGTPCPNNIAELYPMLQAFGAYTGKYWDFVAEFCTGYDSGYRFSITGNRRTALPKFRRMLKPYMLRRMKTDVLPDLPPLTFDTIEIPPGVVDKEIHFYSWTIGRHPRSLEQVVRDEQAQLLAQIDGGRWEPPQVDGKTDGSERPFATMRKYVGLQKVEGYVDHVIEDLRTGAIDKLVVFGVHQMVLESITLRLKEFGAAIIYGGTKAEIRQRRIDAFQNPRSKARVIVANITAAGTAIDLFAAANVDIIEPSYSPAWNAQAIMRVHRSGQTRPVLARFFVLDDEVDQRVVEIIKRKTKDLAEAGLAIY